MRRFAIYFTPSAGSALASQASLWLGRSNRSTKITTTPQVSGISEKRMGELLKAPRHYGFHGTLKPPFRVHHNVSAELIGNRIAAFASSRHAFTLPALKLDLMDGFFCLRPGEDCEALSQLAAETVQFFDDLRLPPDKDELHKRRAPGLTAEQETMLLAWGYPYVMSEFRFHLTLTGRTRDAKEQELLHNALSNFFHEQLLSAMTFDSLSLFIESDGEPMYCISSHPLLPART